MSTIELDEEEYQKRTTTICLSRYERDMLKAVKREYDENVPYGTVIRELIREHRDISADQNEDDE